jgi:hypothetical protein
MDAIVRAFEATLRQLVIGLGPLFLTGTLLFFCQRFTQKLMSRVIGWKGIVYWTGWMGTPVHEASHWLVGKLCGLEITEVKLFSPDERTGVLGYVKYVVPELKPSQLHKVVGTFLTGMAPLFGGTLVILLAWVVLIHPEADGRYGREIQEFMQLAATGAPQEVATGFKELQESVYGAVFAHGPKHPQSWIFLYIALAVGAHLAPSRADLQGGLVGFVVLLVLAILGNLGAVAAGYDPEKVTQALSRGTAPLTVLLVFALSLNLGNLSLASSLAGIKKVFPGKG